MVQHVCCKQLESENMKTILLTDETKITTIKECGKAFFTWHKKEADAKANLDAIKKAIKENDAVQWFKHGISIDVKEPNNFNKDKALDLLDKLGATDEQIASCYVKGSYKTVSKAVPTI